MVQLLFRVVDELNRNMQGEMFDNVDGSVASIGILGRHNLLCLLVRTSD